jgi:hypothetical protein
LELLLQIFGLVLLGVGLVFGYWRWIRPRRAQLDGAGRGLLMLVIITLMGGFIGSPFWWADEPLSFSWDLPLLASRMLASAGWSFFVICLLVLERPTYRRLRLILILLFVYLTPLALAAVLFHLDRFDGSAPITYAFFGIVGVMVLTMGRYLLRQPRAFMDTEAQLARPKLLPRLWMGTVAVITAVWGLALFITDSGPKELIWVWPGDLLTSRLIGVMLLTIATGSVYAARSLSTIKPMLAMTAVYGLGLSLASVWLTFLDKPIKMSYAVVFGLIFLGSLVVLLVQRGHSEV